MQGVSLAMLLGPLVVVWYVENNEIAHTVVVN